MPHRRILLICLRRLGDVLLSTPVVRSLRRAYPDAVIDALVFTSTAGMLVGNPDLRRVIAWPDSASVATALRTAWPLRRRYDLALAVTPSDRAHYLAAWAAPRRYGNVQSGHEQRWLLNGSLVYSPDALHTVTQNLRLAAACGVPPVPEVVPPQPSNLSALTRVLGAGWERARWAVVHPNAMYRYKGWTLEGWRVLLRALELRGLHIAVSGGPGAAEREYLDTLLKPLRGSPGIVDCAGRLSLAEWTPLLRHAALFVGPDTSATHLAAACGTPTLAIFGPSSPLAWGPWPQNWPGTGSSPWQLQTPLQQVGTVAIVQGGPVGRYGNCVPCLAEGCERHRDSVSDCLEQLSVTDVLDAADQLLGGRAPL